MLEMGRYFEQPAPSKPEGPEEWRNPVPPAKNASSANFGEPTGSMLTTAYKPFVSEKVPRRCNAVITSRKNCTQQCKARQPNFRVKVW